MSPIPATPGNGLGLYQKKWYHFLQIIIFVALNTARFQNNTNTFL